jgi:hypothetical protein
MGRLISAGALAYEQLDFFFPSGSISRATGITASDLRMSLFVNNTFLHWDLTDGAAVPDSAISSGHVYFNEISGSPGYYSVRFFPDRVGYFRFVFIHSAYSIELEKEFDILPPGVLRPSSGGVIPSTGSRC